MKTSLAILVGILVLQNTVQALSLKSEGDNKQANSISDNSHSQKRFVRSSDLDLLKESRVKVKRSLDYDSNGSWQYPTNLMVLLRGHGKRGLPRSPEDLEIVDTLRSDIAYPRKRFPVYTKDNSYRPSPLSSRQFMVWRDGNYYLG